jgi:hypothetical protein
MFAEVSDGAAAVRPWQGRFRTPELVEIAAIRKEIHLDLDHALPLV